MNYPTSLDELKKSGLGDLSLKGIEWLDKDFTLVLTIEIPAFRGKLLQIHFTWAAELVVEMDFGEYVGAPLAFDARLSSSEPRRTFAIFFEAAPSGKISFKYNEAKLFWT